MKKSNNQIVGAYFPKPTTEAQTNNPPKVADKGTYVTSASIAPSDEFRAFWGNNVDAAWFEGRKIVSPFVIFIILLTGLTIYLSSRLLFSPGEIEQIFTEATSPAPQEQVPDSAANEENLLTSKPNLKEETGKEQLSDKEEQEQNSSNVNSNSKSEEATSENKEERSSRRSRRR